MSKLLNDEITYPILVLWWVRYVTNEALRLGSEKYLLVHLELALEDEDASVIGEGAGVVVGVDDLLANIDDLKKKHGVYEHTVFGMYFRNV